MHLAICRVLHATGIGQEIELMLREVEEDDEPMNRVAKWLMSTSWISSLSPFIFYILIDVFSSLVKYSNSQEPGIYISAISSENGQETGSLD